MTDGVPRVGIDALALRAGGGLTWLHHLVPALADAWPAASIDVIARPETAGGVARSPRVRVETRDAPRGMLRVPYERCVVPRWVRARGLAAVLVAADAGPVTMPCPFVQVCQNAKIYSGRGLRYRLLRLAARATARAAASTVFVSQALRSVAELVLAPRRAEVIPHGVATPSTRAAPAPIEEPYVLVVATPYAHKEIATALDAVLALRRRGRKERLVLAGGGGDAGVVEDLHRRASGDPDAFDAIGAVGPTSLSAWYAHAAAVMLPSREESSGMPVAEAIAYGVPVIASDVPALVETAGGLASHHAVGDVAHATALLADALAESPADRERRATDGREFAATRSWAEAARRYRAVLEACAGDA